MEYDEMDEPVVLTSNGRRKRRLPQNSSRYKAKENRYSGNGLVPSVACTHNSSWCGAVTLKESDLLYITQQLYFTNDKVKQDAILLSHMDAMPCKRRRQQVDVEEKRRNRDVSIKYAILKEDKTKVPVCQASFLKIFYPMPLKEESQDLNEMEEKDQEKTHHDFRTEEKPSNCSKTETTSSQKMAQKTGNIGDFTCHLCGLSFRKQGSLEVHMRVHTGRKLYPCEQCGVIFNQQGNLKVHMRIHTGEKPFTCSQCGKGFRQKGNLKSHMRVHTGETPYTCKQCGMSFSQKGNLKSHMRVHTGENPYTCKQCGMNFTRKGSLSKHMIVHKTKDSLTCQCCGNTFKQHGNLKVHMKIHSGEKLNKVK